MTCSCRMASSSMTFVRLPSRTGKGSGGGRLALNVALGLSDYLVNIWSRSRQNRTALL
jgi:hypothetical protein